MCGNLELACQIKAGFVAAGTNVMDQLNDQASQAALHTLDSATFWLYPKSAPVATEHGDTWTTTTAVGFVQDRLLSVTIAVFTLAIIVAGMRIAWEQRARPLQELLKAVLIFVVVAAAGTATMQVLIDWSDGFATWLMGETRSNVSLANAFGGPVDADGKAKQLVSSTVPVLLAMSMSLLVMISGLVQMVLMLVRTVMLVLLSGAFPLAAAATNTELGQTWFRKFCGWSLAFIAYKPAAALVYATAIKLTQTDLLGGGDAIVQAMTGMMMLLMAILALPALLRFMVPVTAAVAGGSAGMGSSSVDPGGAASGAINVGRSFSTRLGGARAGGAGGGAGAGGGGDAGAGGGGAGGGAGAGAGGGGGASGARAVGSALGAAAGTAGVGLAAARKTAGALAGAVSHSSGESAGGSITPPSATGPMTARRPSPSGTSRPTHSGASPPFSTASSDPPPEGPSGSNPSTPTFATPSPTGAAP
ncbi:hypothetical protein AB0E69_11950 [Kribbella sp. NPDC026611]|uniref:hypothetical protein n=1 Tax=Kribbella sp. NPDC026611 TaxID=3154911 RepID=UPI0033DD02C0